ncbi:MAG: hypothetical protein ABIQ43_00415 [Sphingomonas sp.]
MKRAMMGLMLLLATPATAAPPSPAVSAKAFVEGLYKPWIASLKRSSDADRTGYMPKDDESVYVPELSALLNKDQRISNRTGDVGVIDWVILCSCQDDSGLGYRVTVPAATAKTATAKVALSFGGTYDRTLTLKLVKLPRGWRIADVVDTEMPSLLAHLRRELRNKR